MEAKPSKQKLVLTVCFLLVVSLSAPIFVQKYFFHSFPNSGDEYSYILQSKIFASGRLSSSSLPPGLRNAVVLDHVLDDDRVRSKYPFGWPLLLVIGELLNISSWVNPILSAVSTLLVFAIGYFAVGLVAAFAAAMVLTSAPMFLFQGASFYNHMSSLAMLALAILLIVLWKRKQRLPWLLAAGLCCGLALTIRPLDAAIFICGFCLVEVFQTRRVQNAMLFGLAAVPGAALFLFYNKLQYGGMLITGYDAYLPMFAKLYGREHGTGDFNIVNIRHVYEHITWLRELFSWTLPGTTLAAIFGVALLRKDSDSGKRLIGTWMLVTLGLYLISIQFTTAYTNNSYGPRYLFGALLPLAILSGSAVARVFATQDRQIKTALFAVASVAMVVNLVFIQSRGNNLRQFILSREEVFDSVKPYGSRKLLVFLRNTPYFPPHWYTRNEPDFGGNIVYAIDRGRSKNLAMSQHFPSHEPFQLNAQRSEGATGGIQLSPLRFEKEGKSEAEASIQHELSSS